ncbi:MAG: sodium-dependent transporter [Halioglobus sp.]|nr:sodium-dependent transporter [Halioglobus sp.]
MAAAGAHWSSRFAFLMATVGFAVGLGNIWRFPYVAGENGGSAFILIYLLCAFGIGMPILMSELLIGRRGQGCPSTAMVRVAAGSGRSNHWRGVGSMGLIAAFVIEIIYAGIVGWVLWYLYKALTTGFAGVTAESAALEFDAVLASTTGMLFWTLVGLGITGLIIYAGVRKGIERAVVVMMPTMILLLVGLACYNVFAGGMEEALVWLLTPDFSKVNAGTVLAAITQAFFSIGVAMGGMMTYGSYLPRSISIGRSALIIVAADTAIALLAGLVIFPAVFNNGLDPAAGTGLIFKTLPVAFAQMPAGHVFGVLFFLMLAVAGITSMVGLVESVNTWVEERYGVTRHKSALLVTGALASCCLLSLMSYNVMSDVTVLGMNFNGILEHVYEKLLLPIGGLLIAVFVGWAMSKDQSRDELSPMDPLRYALWYNLLRYAVPPAILVVLYMGLMG